MTTAIRDLRTAVVAALKAADTAAETRVYTIPVAPHLKTWPRIVVYGYTEDPSNFFGRPGNDGRMLIRCEVVCVAGDAPLEALAEEVEAALDNQALAVDDHTLLIGTLRRTIAAYPDPDVENLWLLPMLYESETRIA